MAKKNFFQSILPYAAGALGSGVSSQFSALSPFSAAIGAGAGALSDLKNPLGGAAAGFAGGGVGSTLAGGVKGAFSGAPGSSTLDNFGSGALSGLQSFGSSIPGFGGVGTSNPTGAFAKFFAPSSTNVLQNGTSGFQPVGSNYSLGDNGVSPSNTSPFTPPSFSGYNPTGGATSLSSAVSPSFGSTTGVGGSPSSGGSSNSPVNLFKSLVPGAAVSLLGGALAPKVPAPDYSGVISQFQNQVQNGGDPAARQAAENYYLSTLNTPNGASSEDAVANARLINDRQKTAANKEITDQFSANNGSTTGNSAYNDAITKSNAAYDQNYAAQAAQAQYNANQLQTQQKLAAANALQGLNDTQLQYYAGLAGLSIEQIQEKTGMDVANANSIKQIATTAGTLLMEKGLGLGGAR